jgi:hypothetical protein
MLELKLSSAEQQLVVEVLDAAIADLGMEISDTDLQDYREMLKERKQTLLKVVGRLRQ